MVMRIGGLASGINTDEIIQKLMSAERMPLDRMSQDRTLLEWQRDGYREIYQKMYEMDTELILNMKFSTTYNSKSVTSSMEGAVTATATSGAQNGSYSIRVDQLASSAINIGDELVGVDPTAALNRTETITFSSYNSELKQMEEHTVDIVATDSLNDVLKKISADGNNVRAFFDPQSNKVVLESLSTGNNNTNGNEIIFDDSVGSFFKDELGLSQAGETDGQNAIFYYNGQRFESNKNSYKMGDITFEFKNTTNNQNVSLTVTNDVDGAFDKIMQFVDKYNEIVDLINKTQTEERFRDYKPLTDEQKKEMDDKEVELWEEKAKSGILRGDTILTSGLFNLRQGWYSKVDTGGEITSLTQVGISTTANYMNGGKLVVDEKKLKEALQNDPEGVYKLFSNNTEKKDDPSRGLINRLEDSLESTMKRIEERAGKTTSTLDNYTIGKRIKDLDTRISDFENRLVRIESRYWSQFSAMEQAIARMNSQSAQLFSQFGG